MARPAQAVLKCTIAIAGALVFSGALTASEADWTPSGPFGGAAEIVRVVPLVPDLVLAATSNALLYQSRNGGASWTLMPFPARFAGTLHALEIDPSARGIWYAGLESDTAAGVSKSAGVYKTQDGGATWKPLPGLAGHSVWSLALWRGDPARVAAGTSDGVYLSRDGGASWARISRQDDTELRPVVSLAFDPKDANIIYAGTTHLPWKTRDGGAHWESIHEGMIDDSDVFSIAVQGDAPASVYSSACSGVYHSGDGGENWKRLETPHGAFRTYFVALDPANASLIFAGTSAGLLRSENRGASWKTVTPEIVRSIAFDRTHADKIFFASSTAGLLLSRNGGVTVSEFNTGFVNRNFTAVTASGLALYAASVYEPGSGGVFRTSNRGLRWVHMGGPKSGNILKLAAAPGDGDQLYAAGYDGLYRSNDGGVTWSKPLPLPGGARISALAPLAGGRLLAGASNGLFELAAGGWRAVRTPGSHSIEQLEVSPGGALAAFGAAGAIRSQDGGLTWTACADPVPQTVWYGLAIQGAVSLAATSRGLFRSTDGCSTWEPARGGLEASTASAVIFHPDRRAEAFVAQSGKVFRTTDAGRTWAPLSGGPADVYPESLFFLDGAPRRIFALFPRRGVFSHSLDATAGIQPGANPNPHITGGYFFNAAIVSILEAARAR